MPAASDHDVITIEVPWRRVRAPFSERMSAFNDAHPDLFRARSSVDVRGCARKRWEETGTFLNYCENRSMASGQAQWGSLAVCRGGLRSSR